MQLITCNYVIMPITTCALYSVLSVPCDSFINKPCSVVVGFQGDMELHVRFDHQTEKEMCTCKELGKVYKTLTMPTKCLRVQSSLQKEPEQVDGMTA